MRIPTANRGIRKSALPSGDKQVPSHATVHVGERHVGAVGVLAQIFERRRQLDVDFALVDDPDHRAHCRGEDVRELRASHVGSEHGTAVVTLSAEAARNRQMR